MSAGPRDQPRTADAPSPELLFPLVLDRWGSRLVLVFGNEAPSGQCPFYRANLCHHCDIGRGEGKRFDAAMNRHRLAWFQERYAPEWSSVAHLVVYNSGSVLNPVEMAPEVLDEIVGFARTLPALRAVSLDSREVFVDGARLLQLALALGAPRRLAPILGLETVDDRIRNTFLEKVMSRAATERAVATIGAAAVDAAREPAAARLGLSLDMLIGGPGAAGGRSIADARATAHYAIGLAGAARVPLELNLIPFYPSSRSVTRFPEHPRPMIADVLASTRAVLDEIHRSGADTTIFLGLHDEGHDQRPLERAGAVDPLRAALARFHSDQEAAWLYRAVGATPT